MNIINPAIPGVMPSAYPLYIPEGCVLYYDMQDMGDAVKDHSPNRNDGAVTGAVAVPYNVGVVRDFNGVANVINCGSDASLDDIVTLSIEQWFKRDGLGGSTAGRHVNKERWYLSAPGSTRLNFTRSATTAGVWQSPSNSILTGQWYHVVVTYDGSNIANKPMFYINGELVATSTSTQAAGVLSSDAGDNLLIGNSAGANRGFDGLIGITRLFNRILSAQEINNLYRANAWRYGIAA
jgi:hypothetical protein